MANLISQMFYVGKGLCVVGRIELRADFPYIVINYSDQVELIEEPAGGNADEDHGRQGVPSLPRRQ